MATVKYVMAAMLTAPPYTDISWSVFDAPDTTGAQSGYFGLLSSIRVDYTIVDDVPYPGTVVLPAGPAGAPGAPGATGPQGPPGSGGLNAYNVATAYVTGNSVSFNGGSFVAKQASTGKHPADLTYWTPTSVGGVYNVKWFGAVGDSNAAGAGTDDTAAFQNAIYAANGATLEIPPGFYRITAPLEIIADSTAKPNGLTYGAFGPTVNASIPITNIRIRGTNAGSAGNGKVILVFDCTTELPMFKVYSAGNSFENIQFVTKTGGSAYAYFVVTQSNGAGFGYVTANAWERCNFGAKVRYCVSIGNDVTDITSGVNWCEAGLDYMAFRDCKFQATYSCYAAVKVWSRLGNPFGHTYDRCFFTSIRQGLNYNSGQFTVRVASLGYVWDKNNPDKGAVFTMGTASAPCVMTELDMEGCPNLFRWVSPGGNIRCTHTISNSRFACVIQGTATQGSSGFRNFVRVQASNPLIFSGNMVQMQTQGWNASLYYPLGVVQTVATSVAGLANAPLYNPATVYGANAQVQYDPLYYNPATAYVAGNIVAYNAFGILDGGLNNVNGGATDYYVALSSTTGVPPSAANVSPAPGAVWGVSTNFGKYYVAPSGAAAGLLPNENPATWKRLELSDYVTYVCPIWDNSTTYYQNQSVTSTLTAPNWLSGTSYAVGDWVRFGGTGPIFNFNYFCIQATSSVDPTNTAYWTPFTATFYSLIPSNVGNAVTDKTKWLPVAREYIYKSLVRGNVGNCPADFGTTAWQSLTGVGTLPTASDDFQIKCGGGGVGTNAKAYLFAFGNTFPTDKWYETDVVENGPVTINSIGNSTSSLATNGIDPSGLRILAGMPVPTQDGTIEVNPAAQPTTNHQFLNLTTITGLSSGYVKANNFKVLKSHVSGTTGSITLPNTEPDALYDATLTIGGLSAAAGTVLTTRVWVTSQTTTQVNYAVDIDPTSGGPTTPVVKLVLVITR